MTSEKSPSKAAGRPSREEAESAVRTLLRWAGDDPAREGLLGTPDRVVRRMPMLLGFLLVAFFIWIAENLGTLTSAWLYPSQKDGWRLVSLEKMGSWYLLMMLSFVLVTVIHRPERAAKPAPSAA